MRATLYTPHVYMSFLSSCRVFVQRQSICIVYPLMGLFQNTGGLAQELLHTGIPKIMEGEGARGEGVYRYHICPSKKVPF